MLILIKKRANATTATSLPALPRGRETSQSATAAPLVTQTAASSVVPFLTGPSGPSRATRLLRSGSRTVTRLMDGKFSLRIWTSLSLLPSKSSMLPLAGEWTKKSQCGGVSFFFLLCVFRRRSKRALSRMDCTYSFFSPPRLTFPLFSSQLSGLGSFENLV